MKLFFQFINVNNVVKKNLKKIIETCKKLGRIHLSTSTRPKHVIVQNGNYTLHITLNLIQNFDMGLKQCRSKNLKRGNATNFNFTIDFNFK